MPKRIAWPSRLKRMHPRMVNILKQTRWGFAVLMMACVLASTPVLACKCAQPTKQSAQDQYDRAAIVGEFKVVPAENQDEQYQDLNYITLVPVKLYKKGDDETIEQGLSIIVQYNPITSACGHVFEAGKHYVLGFEMNNDHLDEIQYFVMNSCAQYGIRFHVKNEFNK